jgi:hypothetical protein
MQEAPEPFVRTEKPAGLAFYLAMLASSAIGLALSIFLAHAALIEIDNSEIRFNVPTDFNLKGTISSTGSIEGRSNSDRISADSESSGNMRATIERDMYSGWSVRFQKPNRPWLCVALVFLLSNVLLYVHRIYLILLRSKAAENMTTLHAKVMAMAGLLYFAGNENLVVGAIMGTVMIAYAGIGYLAYTHWERVRAQLYKD